MRLTCIRYAKLLAVLAFVGGRGWSAAGEAPPPEKGVTKAATIEITSPTNSAQVGMNVIVEGVVRVDDLAGQTPVVVVHPLLTSMLWVQPLPLQPDKIEGGYRFRTRVYCGTPKQGVGEQFELFALLAKKGRFDEADVLDKLPADIPVSAAVLVQRTN